jgi:hypothetical protein
MKDEYYEAEFSGRDPNGSPLLNDFSDAINKAFPHGVMHARCEGDELIIECGQFTAWIGEDGSLNGAASTGTPTP